MFFNKTIRATVLVYTMVLVVIGVFMATVVLNIAVQLSVEYDNRNIEVTMSSIIKTKGDLAMKYARDLNMTGSGFIDLLSCPTGISLSGSTLTTGITTEIGYMSGSIICSAPAAHNGLNLSIFFNNTYDDIEYAQFDGSQVGVNSGSLVGTFGDSDTTQITIPNTSYFTADGYDDNFDSDNYSVSSSGSVFYPDGYFDNDSEGKLLLYGYVLEGAGLYNAFWSNTKIKQYIQANSNNLNLVHQTLGSTGSGFLKLDINGDHALFLYQIDKDVYNDSNEMIITSVFTGTGQTGGVGYLQNDLSIGTGSTDAFNFDFIGNDYALFIENTGSGALLYQITAESALSGSGIYINPLNDSDPSVFSYLGSHVFVDDEGKLIGDMFEVFGLK